MNQGVETLQILKKTVKIHIINTEYLWERCYKQKSCDLSKSKLVFDCKILVKRQLTDMYLKTY